MALIDSTWPGLPKLALTCSNLPKLALTFPNLPKITQTFPKSPKLGLAQLVSDVNLIETQLYVKVKSTESLNERKKEDELYIT